jgi:sulfur-carrier protein
MSRVRIPPVLRAQAENQKQVELEGDTVAAILAHLVERFPGLRPQLVGADGQVNRFVNIYVNDQDIRNLQRLETPVGPSDTVVLLPAMAGGER